MKLKRTGQVLTQGDIEMFKDIEHGVVSPTDYTLYNLIVFMNGMDKWGEVNVNNVFPKAHMSHVTVRRCLKRLVKSGWLLCRGQEGSLIKEYRALPFPTRYDGDEKIIQ